MNNQDLDEVIYELDQICAMYISDHPEYSPKIELPEELYTKLSESLAAKVRYPNELFPETAKLVKIAAYRFSQSGFVKIEPYDGMFPRIRPDHDL